jgi:hypothetical protein
LKYFLGIEIAYSNGELFLSQRKYVLDLLKEISKLGCKPVSILIDRKYKLNSEDEEPLEDINNFQVSSYDIDNKRVDMDEAITQGLEYHN